MDVDSSSSLDWRFGFSLSRPLSTCSTRSCHMTPFVSFRDTTTGLLNLVRARVLLLLLHDHLENGWWWRCYRLKDDNDPVSGDYWIFIIHFYPTTDMLGQRHRYHLILLPFSQVVALNFVWESLVYDSINVAMSDVCVQEYFAHQGPRNSGYLIIMLML